MYITCRKTQNKHNNIFLQIKLKISVKILSICLCVVEADIWGGSLETQGEEEEKHKVSILTSREKEDWTSNGALCHFSRSILP